MPPSEGLSMRNDDISSILSSANTVFQSSLKSGKADWRSAEAALNELERVALTKELLESTRIGLAVNELRRATTDSDPALSKRCRRLIKAWQKLVEVGSGVHRPPSSAGSSRNATPQLVSPATAGRRLLTPNTPGGGGVQKRVTSTGLQLHPGVTCSPQLATNGSYAPKDDDSNSRSRTTTTHSPPIIHKSASAASDLGAGLNGGGHHETLTPSTSLSPPLAAAAASQKRAMDVSPSSSSTNSEHHASSGPDPKKARLAAAPGSLQEARRLTVQSTSDLVASLTANLPSHMRVDEHVKQHEQKMKREQQHELQLQELLRTEQTAPAATTATTTTANEQPVRQKRKYTKRHEKWGLQRVVEEPPPPQLTAETATGGGLKIRFLRKPLAAQSQPQLTTTTTATPTTTTTEQQKKEGEDENEPKKEAMGEGKEDQVKGASFQVGPPHSSSSDEETSPKSVPPASVSPAVPPQKPLAKTPSPPMTTTAAAAATTTTGVAKTADVKSEQVPTKVDNATPPEALTDTAKKPTEEEEEKKKDKSEERKKKKKKHHKNSSSPPPKATRHDWYDMLPSRDELRKRVQQMNGDTSSTMRPSLSPTALEQWRSTTATGAADGDRRTLLLLPYVDAPPVEPDFVRYKYPDSDRFLLTASVAAAAAVSSSDPLIPN